MRISCASVTLLTIAAALPAADSIPVTPTPAADQTLVVTADRRETPIANSTASVAVVTAADDRERGYVLNPWEWLKGIAGVDAVPANGGIDGGVPRVRIRGARSYEAQWLVDGIPVDDPTAIEGGFIPAYLDPAGITRIEVVKGTQSGLYGSRAVGGVINVLTARPTAEHAQVARAEGGSFGTARATVQATGPLSKDLGYALSFDGMRSDGFSAQTDADAKGDPRDHEADGVERLGLTGRLEWQAHATTKVYVALHSLALNQDFDDFASPDDRQSYTQVRSLRMSAGERTRLTERCDVGLDLSWDESQRQSRDPFGITEYDGDQRRFSADARYRAYPWLEIAAGIDGARAEAVTTTSGGAAAVHDWLGGGWAQLYSADEHHDVSFSARQDLHSRAGDAATWRAAAAGHVLDHRLTLRGAVGTAFRAPSLFQSFAPSFGNPNLTPQKSIGYEAGLRAVPVDDVRVESTWFRTDYRDLIAFGPVGYINVGSHNTTGVENSLEADTWERRLFVRGSYTWQERENDGYSTYLPHHLASVAVGARGEPGWVRVTATRRGSATTSAFDAIPRLEWATIVDAAVGVTLGRHWEVYVRGDNLFDERYEVTPGFSTPGRAVYVGGVASF